jgi:hypothetical protein
MMQAVSGKDVATIAQAREVIRLSFDVAEYTPRTPRPWDEAFDRFSRLFAADS